MYTNPRMSMKGHVVKPHLEKVFVSILAGDSAPVKMVFDGYYINDNAFLNEEMITFHKGKYYDAYLLASVLDGGRLCSDMQMTLLACIAFEYGFKGSILAGDGALPSLKACIHKMNEHERILLKNLPESLITHSVKWRIDHALRSGPLELKTRIFPDDLGIEDFLTAYNPNVYCALPDVYATMSENTNLCAHFFAQCMRLCSGRRNADVFLQILADMPLDHESDENAFNREEYRNVQH
jgi:hypothetical protein